ncbi:MAG: hypothetical protein A3A22_00365 [Candidatus Taylorbacteria bacterium RIFCSPLOWO2_01_FULL_45_34b]|nr:MAG: hypothetical protein A3A22_00365 [Candidatus Taylorbacteria bacterium RIFCSPLOWO2_01_FULL_45_34b]
MNISILYEDADLLVINKPSGLVVHPDGRTKELSVSAWVAEHFPETESVGEPLGWNQDSRPTERYQSFGRARFRIQGGEKNNFSSVNSNPKSRIHIPESTPPRSGIVHRIDRETSGVLIIAKSQKAFDFLKKQFQKRTITKIYTAFVVGELKKDDGMLDKPIGKSPRDFRRWSAERGAKGVMREALTNYRVLAKDSGYSLVEVFPKTGRTHQIRVHFKALGHPIVADSLYGKKDDPVFGFTRLALHARAIEFIDLKGKRISVEAPYPADFKKAIKQIQKD